MNSSGFSSLIFDLKFLYNIYYVRLVLPEIEHTLIISMLIISLLFEMNVEHHYSLIMMPIYFIAIYGGDALAEFNGQSKPKANATDIQIQPHTLDYANTEHSAIATPHHTIISNKFPLQHW